MPVSAQEATRRYTQGVQSVGIEAYRRASNTNTPQEAASILEDAKSQNLSIQDFAEKYSNAYTPEGGQNFGGVMGGN